MDFTVTGRYALPEIGKSDSTLNRMLKTLHEFNARGVGLANAFWLIGPKEATALKLNLNVSGQSRMTTFDGLDVIEDPNNDGLALCFRI